MNILSFAQSKRRKAITPATGGEVVKFPVRGLYLFRQHDDVLAVGTLTQVWNAVKNLVGLNMTGKEFSDRGYIIENARRSKHHG